MTQNSTVEPFGLYIHIPYCIKKCPYCDFNSYAVNDDFGLEEGEYVGALIKELEHYIPLFKHRTLNSIFFGGGTPSLLSEHSIEQIFKIIEATFTLPNEVTLEANPSTLAESCNIEKLLAFSHTGINRISLGAQSFSKAKLLRLGRIHKPEDTANSIQRIRQAGISRVNIDLIFGVEGETLNDWKGDLEAAIDLKPEHISLYGLTIEAGTDFGRRAKKGENLTVEEKLSAEMYALAIETLKVSGYKQYEISNFSIPGQECLHNLSYWGGLDYLGLGAGAHGFFDNTRYSNIPGPKHYIERCKSRGEAIQTSEKLTSSEQLTEFFLLGLRVNSGISKPQFRQKFGSDFDRSYSALVSELSEQNLVSDSDESVKLTEKGFLFANTVIEAFTS